MGSGESFERSDKPLYFFALAALRGFATLRGAALLALRAAPAFFAGRRPFVSSWPKAEAASALIWAMVALPVFNAFEAIWESLSLVCFAIVDSMER
jgi:hypothetical protein